MKRIITLLILLLCLTSCSKKTKENIIYDLKISDYYHETITAYLPENAHEIAQKDDSDIPSLEYIFLYENLRPIFSNTEIKYNKTITKEEGIEVELKYNYIEDDFFNSNFLQNCFENYNLTSTSDEVSIELSGKFYCYHDKPIEINIETKNPVISFNGTKKKNTYKWLIDDSNKDNISINFKYNRFLSSMITDYKDIKEPKKKNIIITIDIILIIASLIVIIIMIRRNKK